VLRDGHHRARQLARGTSISIDLAGSYRCRAIRRVDRALDRDPRTASAPNGVIANARWASTYRRLYAEEKGLARSRRQDLAQDVTCRQTYHGISKAWSRTLGYAKQTSPKLKVVAIDLGTSANSCAALATAGFRCLWDRVRRTATPTSDGA